jgi:hypothetical protein
VRYPPARPRHPAKIRERVLHVTRDGTDLRPGLEGDWTLAGGVPSVELVAREIGAWRRRIVVDVRGLSDWESALVTFANALAELGGERGIDRDRLHF